MPTDVRLLDGVDLYISSKMEPLSITWAAFRLAASALEAATKATRNIRLSHYAAFELWILRIDAKIACRTDPPLFSLPLGSRPG